MKNLIKNKHLLLAVVFVIVLPFCFKSGSLVTELLIFAMAACACNLLLGYTGLMSFGQGIFFGIGSYTTGLLALHFSLPLPALIMLSMLMGAMVALFVGWFAIRQRGVYFVMLTLAFSQMFYFLAYSLKDITGGDNGLLGIERPNLELFGTNLYQTTSPWQYYGFVAFIFVVVFALLTLVSNSTFGKTLLAIRDNEKRASALGYNVRAFKLLAFAISGAVTGLAGGLHSLLTGIAPLSNIEYHISEMILLMTVIGGTGSLLASVLGATVYVVAADWLASLWPRWLMLFGLLLIGVTLYMHNGLWGVIKRLEMAIKNRFSGNVAGIGTEETAKELP